MTRMIRLTGFHIYAHHGVLPSETALGQEFVVDICVWVDFGAAAAADDVALTLDYSKLATLIEKTSDKGPFKLIETFCEKIARTTLTEFKQASRVKVCVKKPNAPIKANFEQAEVEITLDRYHDVALSLGANMGEASAALRQAALWLGLSPDIEVLRTSDIFKTPPWGKTDQPHFLNACAIIKTRLSPRALLARAKEIEERLGRTPGTRWGPRPIDIDIITFGNEQHKTPLLTLPHPLATERGFVMIPLAQIAPNLEIGGKSVAKWAETLPQAGIERLEPL